MQTPDFRSYHAIAEGHPDQMALRALFFESCECEVPFLIALFFERAHVADPSVLLVGTWVAALIGFQQVAVAGAAVRVACINRRANLLRKSAEARKRRAGSVHEVMVFHGLKTENLKGDTKFLFARSERCYQL